MGNWTYHAQNILDGTWVHRDLPLRDVEITDVLTGHGSLTANVAPQDFDLMSGGQRILQEWRTVIYPERGGALRGGFIFTSSTFSEEGQVWELTCESFTSYALDEPYNRAYRGWKVDALDVVREIWDYLQDRPNGDLGLVVDTDLSGVLLGDTQPPDKPARADVTYPTGSTYGTAGDPWTRPAKPRMPKRPRPRKRKRRRAETDSHWNRYLERFNERLDAWQAIKQSLNTDRLPEWNAWHDRLADLQSDWEDKYGDREPYRLLWWESPDCGSELERLADETPFDWRERHTWADGTKAAVNHRLQLGYPTIGVRHTDVMFTPGDQVVVHPEVERGGHDFTNHVIALGSGEGRKTKRVYSTVDDDRLRRATVITHKDVKRKPRLQKLARKERKLRTLGHGVRELTVWETTGTLGTYRLGDEIAVDLSDGWSAGQWWHKIVGRRYKPDEDDVVTFTLVRAERVEPEDMDRDITVQYLSGTHAAELKVWLMAADGTSYQVDGVNDPAPGAVQELGVWSLADLGAKLTNLTYHKRTWEFPDPEHIRRTSISGTDARGSYVGYRFEFEDGGSTGVSDNDWDDVILDVKGYELP